MLARKSTSPLLEGFIEGVVERLLIVLSFSQLGSYTPSFHDVGRVLRFEYTPISTRGLVGTPSYAVSHPIAAGTPKVSRLAIVGEPEELATLTVTADYFGGVEGMCALHRRTVGGGCGI